MWFFLYNICFVTSPFMPWFNKEEAFLPRHSNSRKEIYYHIFKLVRLFIISLKSEILSLLFILFFIGHKY